MINANIVSKIQKHFSIVAELKQHFSNNYPDWKLRVDHSLIGCAISGHEHMQFPITFLSDDYPNNTNTMAELFARGDELIHDGCNIELIPDNVIRIKL